jgi:two-component system invasion response regulator UvrY
VIKVLLIDDHDLVRLGLRKLLEADPMISIAGEARTGTEGAQLNRTLNPDVILLDIQLPDFSGLEVTHRLVAANKNIKILALTSNSDDKLPMRILSAGALGYITKNTSQEQLIQAIKTVYTGKKYISPELAQQMVVSRLDSNKGFEDLSDRESEVMMMVLKGITVKQIAKRLNVTSKTVHSYRSRIFTKLNVKNDMELMLFAVKNHIIEIPE